LELKEGDQLTGVGHTVIKSRLRQNDCRTAIESNRRPL